MCCVFDPAGYRDDPGEVEEPPLATTDEGESAVEEASDDEQGHLCC